jgi:polyol permease family/HAD superfamily hydrolase (TIGR01549 family)
MAIETPTLSKGSTGAAAGWVERIGIPHNLRWGFLGLTIFMIGDGVEQGYLAPFLHDRGLSDGHIATLFTIYGAAAAVAAWLSGACSNLFGPAKVMWSGLAIWVGFEILFLLLGVGRHDYPLMLVFYGMRGFGYPLFAYGFLVWIAAVVPPARMGSAVGWFWFAYTGGLPTLGAVFASIAIPRIGQLQTFWMALALVLCGGLLALLANREPEGRRRLAPEGENPVATVLSSVRIAWQVPRTSIGALVRLVNTTSQYAFPVFMPAFLFEQAHFSLQQWLHLFSVIFLANLGTILVANVAGRVFPGFSRLFSYKQIVAWGGGLGTGIGCLLLFYVPTSTHSYALTLAAGIFYGIGITGYVPLSALMPSLAPHNKGAAMSMLSLGAGASQWLGPMITGLVLAAGWGVQGLMWTFFCLYIAAIPLALLLDPATDDAEDDFDTAKGRKFSSYQGVGSLLAHSPAVSVLTGVSDIDLVLFDAGGTIYGDDNFARTLLQATKSVNPAVDEATFWHVFDHARLTEEGSLSQATAKHFVPREQRQEVETLVHSQWSFPEGSLFPDARPTLEALAKRFRLGIVSNAGDRLREALERDGLASLFTVLSIRDSTLRTKNDPAHFRAALQKAGVSARHAVHVGNRLSGDVRVAERAGLRTVWVLRGATSPAPTKSQLMEPDAVITSLIGLPVALARLGNEDP